MIIVCNSSVLIALSAIGQLDLLQKRCEGTKLMIPKAVWREVVEEGRKVLGTVGLLIWAKREGLIESVQEQLDALREKAGFRISPELYERALKEAGELNK